MTLRDLILSEPANAARTDAEVLAWLHETVTAPDPTRVTTTTVMARLSPTDAAAVFGTLSAAADANPLVAEALIQLRGEGLDLSHANARAMIDALFAEPLRSALKALGERQVSRYVLADWIGASPHLGDVMAARTP